MTWCAGISTPIESRPPVAMSWTSTDFGSTSVNGPGQHVSASRVASAGHAATSYFAISTSATCAMSGLSDGRPLNS